MMMRGAGVRLRCVIAAVLRVRRSEDGRNYFFIKIIILPPFYTHREDRECFVVAGILWSLKFGNSA